MKALWTLFLVFGIAHAETLTGYVVGVSDGDTVTVLDAKNQQRKIRLAGIDGTDSARTPVLTFNRDGSPAIPPFLCLHLTEGMPSG